MKKTLILLYIILNLFLNPCSLKAQDDLKIVALAPVITSDLILLDLEKNIIANTTYCINTNKYSPAKIGSVSNISTEHIVALNPDIIFCGELNDKSKIDKIKEMGFKVVFIPYPKTFNQMCENLLTIAKATNKEQEALRIIKSAKEQISTLKENVDHNSPKVFVQIGADPLFTANKDSFINDLIKYAGGINICEDAKSGMYSKEAVITASPDIILISEMGINGKKEKEKWSLFKSIKAVANDNIYVINEYMLCSPNVKNFPLTLKAVIEIFRKSKSA